MAALKLTGILFLVFLTVISNAYAGKKGGRKKKCCQRLEEKIDALTSLVENLDCQAPTEPPPTEPAPAEPAPTEPAPTEPPRTASSCKEIYDDSQPDENKAYTLQLGSEKHSVYCNMNGQGLGDCGGGGWTMVMKIDGNKQTFHYDSSYWSVNNAYNVPGGKTGLDHLETKLPTYWNTPFTKICLGMKIPGQGTRFLVLYKQASSLHALISDGHHRSTSLGRDTWKKLIGSQASLQRNCNREGFNARSDDAGHSRARIGIVSNQENDCITCDSRIGFGTGGKHDNSNSCGNEATHSPDNGNKHIKAFGYILVQ